MTIAVLDYFKLKPEFLPASLAMRGVYVRPNELEKFANPSQWEYVGRTYHPNHKQAADVERHGYCNRSLPAGRDWSKVGKAWYDHPASVIAHARDKKASN